MDKKRIISLVVMIIGLIMLAVGIVFLILRLNAGPAMADGEYLVSVGSWELDEGANCADTALEVEAEDDSEDVEATAEETNCIGGSGVIWQFTEVGKGTLTTNNHKNDYGFAWALEDGRMIVQTDWLYELDNDYDYMLDQGSGVLVLSDGEHEYRFVAQTK